MYVGLQSLHAAIMFDNCCWLVADNLDKSFERTKQVSTECRHMQLETTIIHRFNLSVTCATDTWLANVDPGTFKCYWRNRRMFCDSECYPIAQPAAPSLLTSLSFQLQPPFQVLWRASLEWDMRAKPCSQLPFVIIEVHRHPKKLDWIVYWISVYFHYRKQG